MINIKNTTDYKFILGWFNKFLSDLSEYTIKWESENSGNLDKVLTKDLISPWKIEYPGLLKLKNKYWVPRVTENYVSFKYYPKTESKFNLYIKLSLFKIEIIVCYKKTCIFSVSIHGLNWNFRSHSFTLITPFISVLIRDAKNEELKKIKGKSKLIPKLDQNFEFWLRSMYNGFILDLTPESSSMMREYNNPKEWDTEKFYYYRDEEEEVFFRKNWKDTKSPIQLIKEELGKLKTPSIISTTYTICSDNTSIKKVGYPKNREFIFLN